MSKGYFLSVGLGVPTGEPAIGTNRPSLNLGALYFQPLSDKYFGYLGASSRIVDNEKGPDALQFKHQYSVFAGTYYHLSPKLDLLAETEFFRSTSPLGEYGGTLRVGPRFILKNDAFFSITYRYNFITDGSPRALTLAYALPFR